MVDALLAQETIKSFILENFLPDEDPDQLTADTELFASQIIDSMATLKLVAFLEATFDIPIAAYEVDADNLGTISRMAAFVSEKVGSR